MENPFLINTELDEVPPMRTEAPGQDLPLPDSPRYSQRLQGPSSIPSLPPHGVLGVPTLL